MLFTHHLKSVNVINGEADNPVYATHGYITHTLAHGQLREWIKHVLESYSSIT